MASYSLEALGLVVRDARRRSNLTQEELGRASGYGRGAGVSISRLESGQLEPSAERFSGVAEALALSPEELIALAAAATSTHEDGAQPNAANLRERGTRIQSELHRRADLVEHLGQEFNDAHDRARDEFLLRLVDTATRLSGAPRPDPGQLLGDPIPDTNATEAEATYSLRFTKFGVAQRLPRFPV